MIFFMYVAAVRGKINESFISVQRLGRMNHFFLIVKMNDPFIENEGQNFTFRQTKFANSKIVNDCCMLTLSDTENYMYVQLSNNDN